MTTPSPQIAEPSSIDPHHRRPWRFTPHVIIFCSSACIMVVELVAGRLIARHVGSSLYTWTTIIGVVLAGMSVGNWIGGRMADRWAPKAFLGWLFMVASALCVLALVTNHMFADMGSAPSWQPAWLSSFLSEPGENKWVIRIVLAVVAIFLPPALALGAISPATAKLALDRSARVGSTLGSVYAWGAVGSIVGTFVTGFYLIAFLGATGVVLTTAMGLALIGLALGPCRWAHVAWVVLLAAALFVAKGPMASLRASLSPRSATAGALAQAEDWAYQLELRQGQWYGRDSKGPGHYAPYAFAKDSDYQLVRVMEWRDNKNGGRTIRTVILDMLEHGYVDMNDPTFLRYEYEHIYRDLTRRCYAQWHDREPAAAKSDRAAGGVDAFFIGGGAYAFQRWVLAEWPASRVDVAEIDPMVLEANLAATGLPRQTPIKTYIGDARNVMDDLPAGKRYDFVFGDAFNDLSVPFHLTTLEFSRKVASHLKPTGVYLVNVIDDFRFGKFLGAYVQTLQQVFKHVYVFATEAKLDARDTFVVAAANTPLDLDDLLSGPQSDGLAALARATVPSARFPGLMLTADNLAELFRKSGPRILTDDDAPVENLLAPVVRTRNETREAADTDETD